MANTKTQIQIKYCCKCQMKIEQISDLYLRLNIPNLLCTNCTQEQYSEDESEDEYNTTEFTETSPNILFIESSDSTNAKETDSDEYITPLVNEDDIDESSTLQLYTLEELVNNNINSFTAASEDIERNNFDIIDRTRIEQEKIDQISFVDNTKLTNELIFQEVFDNSKTIGEHIEFEEPKSTQLLKYEYNFIKSECHLESTLEDKGNDDIIYETFVDKLSSNIHVEAELSEKDDIKVNLVKSKNIKKSAVLIVAKTTNLQNDEFKWDDSTENMNISIFKCKICSKKCNSLINLKVHEFNRHNPKKVKMRMKNCKYYCQICDTHYRSEHHLSCHYAYKHRRKTIKERVNDQPRMIFQCVLCPHIFDEDNDRILHEQTFHQNKVSNLYDCSHCNSSFNDCSTLKQHISSQHAEIDIDPVPIQNLSSRKYECEICKKAFKVKYQYEHHMLTHGYNACDSVNSFGMLAPNIVIVPELTSTFTDAVTNDAQEDDATDEPESYPCVLCNKSFASTDKLQSHGYYMHNPRRKTPRSQKFQIETEFYCKICKKNYKSHRDLQSHIQYKHKKSTREVIFKCRVCSVKYDKRAERNQHEINEHQNSETKLWNCSACQKTYSTIELLSCHMSTHTGRYVICEQCGKSFTGKRYLLAHMQTHIVVKVHSCTMCNKSFALALHLKRHQERHKQLKPFHCTQCTRKFTEKKDLLRHQFFHSDIEKTVPCQICDKTFYTEQFLKVHMKTHIQ